MTHPDLAPAEMLALDALVRRATAAARHRSPLTPGKLLEKLDRFARDVERGYEYALYDYQNDLDLRSVLERVIATAPTPRRQKLEPAVAEWDRRFMSATRAIGRPPGPGEKVAEHWWLSRVPNRLLGELADDLAPEGLLDGTIR